MKKDEREGECAWGKMRGKVCVCGGCKTFMAKRKQGKPTIIRDRELPRRK